MEGLNFLFLSTKPTRPSHRYRVEQMLPHLEKRGHRCSVGFFPKSPIDRFWYYRQLPQFDAVIIQQRILNPLELSFIRSLSHRLVFDMDDAVMFKDDGVPCRHRVRRFKAMINSVDQVICGNDFLRGLVHKYTATSAENRSVITIPTSINTDRFRPKSIPKKPNDAVTIGWTGSRSTNRYLNSLFPTLAGLKVNATLKVISDTTSGLDFSLLGKMPYQFVKWSAETEVNETSEFDIGLMPLPDNNSTRGKCACKALQYMALGIPAVCSPVGVNCEIIHHSVNGYLPQTPQDWTTTLKSLVTDTQLRRRVGQSGRTTVEAEYSADEAAGRLTDSLEECCYILRRIARNATPNLCNLDDLNQRTHAHFDLTEPTRWRMRKTR